MYFSDWLSPKNALIVNHESKNIVRDIASQYIFLDPSLRRRSWRLFSLAVTRYIQARRWVLNGLLEGNYFDDAFIVISEIDWMFHSFYNLFLSDTPPSFLKMPLKELDALIHDLLRIAEKKFSNIVIIADHGFHVYKELVFINEILRRFGWARGITLRFVSKKAKVIIDSGLKKHDIEKFDRELRKEDNMLNPGTTADLVTSSLMVALLRGVKP